MANIKGKGQRLIPEELLKYLEAYTEYHPDPTQGGGATLDDIVDSDGHKRFVEGEGETSLEHLNTVYKKWSLSGTHLMLVFACNTGNQSIDTSIPMVEYTLPKWIYDKIYPVSGNILERKTFYMYSGGSLGQTLSVFLKKDSDNKISMYPASSSSLSNNTDFRFQFDLLIDSD